MKNIGPRLVCFFLITLLFVLTGAQAALAEPQGLTSAKDQAAALEAQLAELKAQAATLQEKYVSATELLAQIEADAADNADAFARAQEDQLSAESALSDRVVQIYKQGRSSLLQVLLGSASLSELLDRVTLLERIGKQDADLVQQVTDYRAEVADQAAKLTAQLEKQQAAADLADAANKAMTQKLAEAQQALKGKEAEVAQLEKAWRAAQAKQAQLERERQARLQAALAAAQAAAQNGGSSNGGNSNGGGSTTNTTTTARTTTTTSGSGTSGGSYHAGVPNILKPEQLALVAQKAGFSGNNLVIAVAVAIAESGGNANAIGKYKTYGLWQILASAHPSMINPSNPDASRWFDAFVNARFAYKISGGSRWSAWSVYNSGSYKKYLTRAQAGVDLLLSNPGAVSPPTVK